MGESRNRCGRASFPISCASLRVAEVVELDMVIDEGKVTAYRAKLKVSFKVRERRINSLDNGGMEFTLRLSNAAP